MKLTESKALKYLAPLFLLTAVVALDGKTAQAQVSYTCLDEVYVWVDWPGYPAGAHYCEAGDPTPNEVAIYDEPNEQGWCVAIPASVADLSLYGWNNAGACNTAVTPLVVQSFRTGSQAFAYIYQNVDFNNGNYNSYSQWAPPGTAYNTSGSVSSIDITQ